MFKTVARAREDLEDMNVEYAKDYDRSPFYSKTSYEEVEKAIDKFEEAVRNEQD